MSDKFYSFASFEESRLPALHAALAATVPCDRLNLQVQHLPVSTVDIESTLRNPKGVPLPITWTFTRADGELRIKLLRAFTILMVIVVVPDAEEEKEIHGLVRDTLALKPPTDEEMRGVATDVKMNQLLWIIHDKLDKLQLTVKSTTHDYLRCFISFRFDDHSKALALELREFLELVGVEFVSGLGFEPRSVSEKVLARLSGPLDLFIVIHSSSGDSAWLNQEVGVARARTLPVIVLREGDAPYDRALLGDAEYIQFPEDAISKAHVPLLQAIRFVRESRRAGA